MITEKEQLEAEIAERDAQIAELEAQAGEGTSSNKYRAELYDEVWQAARDMGYGNVSGALQELAALKAQQPSAGAADEREAYVYWITTEHGDVFDKGLAEHYWEKEHVSALSWQARARLNQPAASAGVVLPEPFEMRPFQTVDQGSTNYKAGFNAAIRKVRESLNPCRAKAVQICKLGMYGQAYDTPGTYRAYTYADQPGNVIAHTLGGCLRAAHCDGGGDFIDFGLALLMRLQDRGFGVFQIATAPSAQQKESGDE